MRLNFHLKISSTARTQLESFTWCQLKHWKDVSLYSCHGQLLELLAMLEFHINWWILGFYIERLYHHSTTNISQSTIFASSFYHISTTLIPSLYHHCTMGIPLLYRHYPVVTSLCNHYPIVRPSVFHGYNIILPKPCTTAMWAPGWAFSSLPFFAFTLPISQNSRELSSFRMLVPVTSKVMGSPIVKKPSASRWLIVSHEGHATQVIFATSPLRSSTWPSLTLVPAGVY